MAKSKDQTHQTKGVIFLTWYMHFLLQNISLSKKWQIKPGLKRKASVLVLLFVRYINNIIIIDRRKNEPIKRVFKKKTGKKTQLREKPNKITLSITQKSYSLHQKNCGASKVTPVLCLLIKYVDVREYRLDQKRWKLEFLRQRIMNKGNRS